jgi:hypothetical protein
MLMVQAWDNQGEAPEGWGSHIMVRWCDFEPLPGAYRLDLFTSAIERRDRPCYVQIIFSMFDQVAGVPVDLTPRHHKRSIRLSAGGLVGEIPNYDGKWTEAYCRAVEALANGLRDQRRVVGYWHAAGWNTETQAVQSSVRGVAWGTVARPLLSQNTYYTFISVSTKRALAAWGKVSVYLPGAPAPGALWGTKRRDVIADLLRAGAGYLNCALLSDNDTSIEVGVRAGQGMYDIGVLAARRGFEEGPRLHKSDPMELYWMLLRAAHWQADFVNLYRSLSAPQAPIISDLLPRPDACWIVFRDAEYPVQKFSAGGKVYGQGGEPGNWGCGITAAVAPVRRGTGYGFDRWVLVAEQPLVLQVVGEDGLCVVTIWRPDGSQVTGVHARNGGRLTLPAGEYHRVDVVPLAALTLEERVVSLEWRVRLLEALEAPNVLAAT